MDCGGGDGGYGDLLEMKEIRAFPSVSLFHVSQCLLLYLNVGPSLAEHVSRNDIKSDWVSDQIDD